MRTLRAALIFFTAHLRLKLTSAASQCAARSPRNVREADTLTINYSLFTIHLKLYAGFRVAGDVAAYVDRDRQSCNVRGCLLDVYRKTGDSSAEALRTYA